MVRTPVAILIGISLWAATPLSPVNEVIEVVRSGLRDGDSDNAIARSLRKLKLGERMDIRVIEELESEGAGQKTIGELELLREPSQTLPAPAAPLPFTHAAPPSAEERTRVLDGARESALNYSKSLPDFICMQTVRRFDTLRGRWLLKDTLDVKLTFFEQKEDYRLLRVNGRPAVISYRDVGGAISQGEFGSLLRLIFDDKSQVEFQWAHWTRLRKRPAHVFSFRTDAPIYRLEISRGREGTSRGVAVRQRGYVYVDRDTGNIVRIVAEAHGIPAKFPVRTSSTALDYELTKVGARDFLLPLRAEIRMGTDSMMTLNEVRFNGYQRFSAEATISFEPK